MACLTTGNIILKRFLPSIHSRTFAISVSKSHICVTKHINYTSRIKCNQNDPRIIFIIPGAWKYSGNANSYSTTAEKTGTPVLNETAEDKEESEKRAKAWKKMKFSLISMGSCFAILTSYAFYTLGAPQTDEEGNVINDEFTNLPLPLQYCKRFINQLIYYKKVIQEPSQEKLLPDPVTYPYIQPPYTLVVELTGLLVHPDWTYKTGWRFKKRPHVDHFLEQVGPPLFELVVFTAEQPLTIGPIIQQLNKDGVIVYTLFRDSTDFVDNHHVKNLDWLNRDLSKVIVVDLNKESVKLHPDNAFILPKWTGNDDDHTLLDLATFLRTIAYSKVDDVREVLQYYRQFENPIEAFRENQRKLLEQMEEQERLEQAKKEHPPLTQRFSKSYVNFKR